MKKVYSFLISLVIFIPLFWVALFMGTETVNDCYNGLCSTCPDVVINPVIRPISFAVLNLPNALKGLPLSKGCGQGISFNAIILDLVFLLFLTKLIKGLIIALYRRLIKREKNKTFFINFKTTKGTIYVAFIFVMLILMIINIVFYYFTPKALSNDVKLDFEDIFQPEIHRSDDFKGGGIQYR